MTPDDIVALWREHKEVHAFARAVEAIARAHEREAVLITVDELMGSEKDRHPMFSDGYDYALGHIEEFVKGRANR
jgi:hypothetical protein